MVDIYIAPKEKKPEKKKKKVVEKRSFNPLAAFIAQPKDIRFETQEKKEKIVLFLRRHWLTNVGWIIGATLMIFAPLLLKFFPLLVFLPPRFRFISLVVWYMLTLAFVFEKFLSWFFNVNIITDERIVDVDFPSLLYRDISSAKIDQIQDVSVKVGGFVRSLFDYGDVLIQTAGTVPEFCFEAVPHPTQVAKIINEQIIQEEQEKIDGRVR